MTKTKVVLVAFALLAGGGALTCYFLKQQGYLGKGFGGKYFSELSYGGMGVGGLGALSLAVICSGKCCAKRARETREERRGPTGAETVALRDAKKAVSAIAKELGELQKGNHNEKALEGIVNRVWRAEKMASEAVKSAKGNAEVQEVQARASRLAMEVVTLAAKIRQQKGSGLRGGIAEQAAARGAIRASRVQKGPGL